MSWDQGVTPREELPQPFIDWVEAKKGGARLEYICWFGVNPTEIIADFGEAGSMTIRRRDGAPVLE